MIVFVTSIYDELKTQIWFFIKVSVTQLYSREVKDLARANVFRCNPPHTIDDGKVCEGATGRPMPSLGSSGT